MEIALDRQAVARRGKQLEYFTIAWNSMEGLVAVVAGALAIADTPGGTWS